MERFLSLLQKKKRVIVYGETSGWAPAGADKSKICPLVHWVGKILFHLPSRKTCLPYILLRHHLETADIDRRNK